MNAGQDCHVLPNPHIIPHDGIAFQRHIRKRREFLVPTGDIKRIGRNTTHLVVRAVHYELHARGNLTELPDNQAVAVKIVVVCDMTLKVPVAEISIITNNDVGAGNRRPDVRNLRCGTARGAFRLGQVS
jgi:hypothetical protein